jgi:epoxyqueuosine reductase QueG
MGYMSSSDVFLHTIQQQLDDFVLHSPKNIVADLGMMRIYGQPLLAVASAEDMYWETLKQPDVVGACHLSPTEWLSGARSVLSCFLPYTERIRSANRTEGWPATEWLYGRYEGGAFVNDVCRFLVKMVQQAGGLALAPSVDGRFAVANLRSNWSERHVAFIAGLGTFSLSRSLITNLGSAGRLGSVITDLAFEPTTRPYTAMDEYCTKCGVCIRRCPPKAIDNNGKNNAVCATYLNETLLRYKPRYGCGKCQTAVPCEARRPPAA